ncbi:reverse transcriptase domain-containing protein [Tanacetum coccineum]
MLDGPTRGWFDRLPNSCIDNWADLREKFAKRFVLRRRCFKDPTEVSKIIQKANETLLDFKERWTYEMSYIQDVPEVMQISAFMSNSKCPKLARRFSDQVLRTVTEMMKRVDDFIKSEEVYRSTELPREEFLKMGHGALHQGDRPLRSAYGGGRQMTDYRNDFNAHRDHYQPYVPPRANNRRYDNRRQESNHLGIDALTKRPKEILATEFQLQLPHCPPMRQLEITLESGKLSHLINDVRQRGNVKGRQHGNNNSKGKVINLVWAHGDNKKRKSRTGGEEDWLNVPITFPSIPDDDVSDEL